MTGAGLLMRERIIPAGVMSTQLGILRAVPVGDRRALSPRTHEETQLAESSILQNRRGTRYLMFDDNATIADVFALRCRTSPNAPSARAVARCAKVKTSTGTGQRSPRV